MRRRNCCVFRAVERNLGKFSKIVGRLGHSQHGFVWIEFEVTSIYTKTDLVFVGELDVNGFV